MNPLKRFAALLASTALGLMPAFGQTPAQLSVTQTLPEVLQVLDNTQTWVPLGTVDPNSHTFTSAAGSVTAFGASGLTETGVATVNNATVSLDAPHQFVNKQGVLLGGNPALTNPGAPFAGTQSSCAASPVGATGVTQITYWVVTLDSFGGYSAPSSCQVTNANLVSITGYIVLTQLYVVSVNYGTVATGMILTPTSGANPVVVSTVIGSQVSGTPGGVGVYNISNSQTVGSSGSPVALGATFGPSQNVAINVTVGNAASFTGSAANGLLTVVPGSATGIVAEGQTLRGFNTRIIGYGSSPGTYLIDSNQTIASQALTTYAGFAIWKQCTANCNGLYASEAFLGYGDQSYPYSAIQTPYVDAGLLSQDAGGNGPYRVSWLPLVHPPGPQGDWCVTQILGGGGTSTLTVAPACPTPATGVPIQHDETQAFNACRASPQRCTVPAGTFNISGALIGLPEASGEFYSVIRWWGAQDLFAPSALGKYVAGGGFVINGQGTDALGRIISANNAAMGPLHDIDALWPFDGFHFYDSAIMRSDNLKVENMQSTTGSCWHTYYDKNGPLGSMIYITCSTAGGTQNYGNAQRCGWVDGASGGGDYFDLVIASCAGEGWRVSNDISALFPSLNISAPFGQKYFGLDVEFTTGIGTHVTGGAQQIRFVGGGGEDSGWKNPNGACPTSANFVIDNGSSYITVTDGDYYAAVGDGIYSDGQNIRIHPGTVANNSSRGAGGVNSVCSGIHLGPDSNIVSVGGVIVGGNGDKQLYPVVADPGSKNITVGGNAFNPVGNLYNHFQNNGAASNVACGNAGTDIPESCNVPVQPQYGPLYRGIGDQGLVSLLTYWSTRCLSNAYAGLVLDIWDASTGSTTETKLTCSAGGLINQTVNPLATTCASGCRVAAAYDEEQNSLTATSNFVQANNALRPNFGYTAAQCGLSILVAYPYCLQFTGTQYMQTGAVAVVNQPFDLVVAMERTGNFTNAAYALALNSGTFLRYSSSVNQITVSFGTGVNATAADSQWHSIQAEANGASGAIGVDTNVQAANMGTNGSTTVFTLGATETGATPVTANFAEGFITAAVNQSLWSAINSNQHTYLGF
jgi:hypothetical protein